MITAPAEGSLVTGAVGVSAEAWSANQGHKAAAVGSDDVTITLRE